MLQSNPETLHGGNCFSFSLIKVLLAEEGTMRYSLYQPTPFPQELRKIFTAALAEACVPHQWSSMGSIQTSVKRVVVKKNLHYLVIRAYIHEQFLLFAFHPSLRQVTMISQVLIFQKQEPIFKETLSADLFTQNLQHRKETLQTYFPSIKYQ